MLTSYWVRCPRPECRWSGDLLPREDRAVYATAIPSKKVVTFHCPKCRNEFQGRVRGDDVVPLAAEEVALLST